MSEDEHRAFDRKLSSTPERAVKNTNISALLSAALLEEE